MSLRLRGLAALLALALAAGAAHAVDLPPEGGCPPYPVPQGDDAGPAGDDVVPRLFRSGEILPLDRLEQLSGYLPPEIWQRRDVYFFEGQLLEVGPCHRVYPAAPFYDEATERDAGKARVDEDGNLYDYSGEGLPFRWQDIDDEAPE